VDEHRPALSSADGIGNPPFFGNTLAPSASAVREALEACGRVVYKAGRGPLRPLPGWSRGAAMDFTRREIALIIMAIGVVMICLGAWMEHRRQYRLMPYLVAPLPLMIFGAAIAFISLMVALLPSQF
jgi:hypothetical protein